MTNIEELQMHSPEVKGGLQTAQPTPKKEKERANTQEEKRILARVPQTTSPIYENPSTAPPKSVRLGNLKFWLASSRSSVN